MLERDETGIILVREVRIREANPGMKDWFKEKFGKPEYVREVTRFDRTKVVDLEETQELDGRVVFVVAGGSDANLEDNFTEPLIEMLSQHLKEDNWEGITEIVNSLLSDYKGRPGGMHMTALHSSSIGRLCDVLSGIGKVCVTAPSGENLATIIKQALIDLSFDGGVPARKIL